MVAMSIHLNLKRTFTEAGHLILKIDTEQYGSTNDLKRGALEMYYICTRRYSFCTVALSKNEVALGI